jgi:hypothetical protein
MFIYSFPGNVRLPRQFANKLFGALLGRLKPGSGRILPCQIISLIK